MPTIYPYTVTNSQKGGFFMRTYNRNVRRAWDGDHYHAPKRQKLDNARPSSQISSMPVVNENMRLELEDNLQRAIRQTSVAMSSSPSRKNSTVSSLEYDAPEPVTPPSSPPPMLAITPPNMKQRKPIFSGLDKKKQKEKEKLSNAKRKRDEEDVGGRDEGEPLAEITNSSTRLAPAASTAPYQHTSSTSETPSQRPTAAPASLSRSMTQTVLDFGQSNTPVTCSQCQMSYTPSVAEDVKLHAMYHDRNKDGIELDKPFMKSAMKWCYETPGIEGSVVVVDRKISLPARRTVQKVLEVVNKELGSVEIPEADLWGQKTLEGDSEDAKKVDCYKVFLHMLNGKCVAVCLAERISRAYKVRAAQNPPAATEGATNKDDPALLTPTSSAAPQLRLASSADIQLEEQPSNVVVGVSRIWTSKSYRNRGIANNLLECVGNQFIYGMFIEKEEVAFSQPTNAGAALARAWYGNEAGWCVYKEI